MMNSDTITREIMILETLLFSGTVKKIERINYYKKKLNFLKLYIRLTIQSIRIKKIKELKMNKIKKISKPKVTFQPLYCCDGKVKLIKLNSFQTVREFSHHYNCENK